MGEKKKGFCLQKQKEKRKTPSLIFKLEIFTFEKVGEGLFWGGKKKTENRKKRLGERPPPMGKVYWGPPKHYTFYPLKGIFFFYFYGRRWLKTIFPLRENESQKKKGVFFFSFKNCLFKEIIEKKKKKKIEKKREKEI